MKRGDSLQPARRTTRPLGLLPFFEHLAPEGWLRGRQARAGGTADQDDLGLLLNCGADCIGAVGILPAEEKTPVHPIEDDIIDEGATTAGRTLSGVQKKLLAYRAEDGFRPSVEIEDPATHIVKFNREDLLTIVQNEHLSLTAVKRALSDLGRRFAGTRTLQLGDKVQPDDFRVRYRDINWNQAQRIFR